MSLPDLFNRRRGPESADRIEPSPQATVIDTARMLRCSEFDIFRLAHDRWFGASVSDKTIEESFTPYVFAGETPFWVRFFCNGIRELNQAGELDPAHYPCTRLLDGKNTSNINILIA